MSSRGINKVILVGNCGKDPEVRYTPSGKAIANVTLATSDSWKDKTTGEQQERTGWHRVVFFGKLAEIVGEYVKKGQQLYVEGSLQTRKWQGQDGTDKYTTEVKVDGFGGQMQMLGGKSPGGGESVQAAANQDNSQVGLTGAHAGTGPGKPDAFDDDFSALREAVSEVADEASDVHPATAALLGEFDIRAVYRTEDGEGFFRRGDAEESIWPLSPAGSRPTKPSSFEVM